MEKIILTGRGIIQVLYPNKDEEVIPCILLSLEKFRNKYGIPGGTFDNKLDSNTLDTAVREISEELGIEIKKSSAEKLFTYNGEFCDHDIYLLDASGTITIDSSELLGIGFTNKTLMIPLEKIERHVKYFIEHYLDMALKKRAPSNIKIPLRYIDGRNNDVISWKEQCDSFK